VCPEYGLAPGVVRDMLTRAFKRPFALLTILGALLIAAAPAGANPGACRSSFTAAQPKELACELMAGITYNGHAGLGAH
jgi:hypothetical protein